MHVKSERHLDKILALVRRLATNRVGVSARFDDLRDAPHALHFARVMLRGLPDEASPVAVFDGSILATAAVSAPEVMVKSIGDALDGFRDLPDDERKMLFETFRVWQDNDASVRSAAEVLVCHPNTVRHRLRRIEKRTGRSLAPKGCRRTMFGLRSASSAHVAMWVRLLPAPALSGDNFAVAATLYRTTTPDIAARAKLRCGPVKVDRATIPVIDDANP